ncbi:MAG: helix-turn-helix domain-containing protein, partial [Candidatus Kapaibacterium sp.]
QFDGYLILFTDDFVFNYLSKSTISLIEHLYNYHLSKPIVSNLKLNNSFLNQLITEIETENDYGKNYIIASLLSLYLLKLDRESQSKESNNHSSIHYNTFIQFKDLVQSKFTITRNVKDYAEMMLVSNKKINSAVRHYTLDTAKNFIDNYVTLEATRAIVSTDKSIKEIAYDVGFEEVTNFTKFFKNKIGVSPNTFRSKNK